MDYELDTSKHLCNNIMCFDTLSNGEKLRKVI